ncbi:hypothetical protein LXL04_036489 [Taraxacum kok-saghyz]
MSRKRTIDYFFKPVHEPQVHSVAENIGEVEDEPIYVEPTEIGEVEEEPMNIEHEEIEKKDAAFCFPCYLFNKKPIGKVGSDTFTITGFNKWKKVNCGKDCAFIVHKGKTPRSAHNFSVRCYEDLKNQLCHIENVIEKQTRLRNTMSDDFLRSCLLVNIEREIADTFSTYKIIDDFYLMKQRRAQLKVRKVNG